MTARSMQKFWPFRTRAGVAQPETEIKLVVRRLMSDLAATEDEGFTTDNNGEASAEFNLSIPGDAQGNIIIGAKIDDHEMFGSLLSTKAANGVCRWILMIVSRKVSQK